MAKKQDIKAGKPIKFKVSSRGILHSLSRNSGSTSLAEQKQHKIFKSRNKYLKPGGQFTPSPSKTFRQGLYVSGPATLPIENRAGFRAGLKKAYGEFSKDKVNAKLAFDGWANSEANVEITRWAKENKIELSTISRESGWSGMDAGDGSERKAFENMSWREKGDYKEKTLTDWEFSKRIKRIALNKKGQQQYSGADRTHWWNRYKAIEEKFGKGKGKTKQVVEQYLDELEDAGQGSSLQNPSKSQTISRKGIKTSVLPQLDQGVGTTITKKANLRSMLAGLDILEEKDLWGTRHNLLMDEGKVGVGNAQPRPWLNKTNKARVAGLRGDKGVLLKHNQRIETDVVDSIVEGGTDNVVTDNIGQVGTRYDLKKQEFVDQKVSPSPKGLKVAPLVKPKDKRVSKIISDLINAQQKQGYSGTNVFGDFFETDLAKDQDVDESQGKVSNEFRESSSIKSHQAKIAQKETISWAKEQRGLNRLVRIQNKAKFPMTQVEYSAHRKSILTGLKTVGDVTARDLRSSLGASFASGHLKIDGSLKNIGKVKGDVKWQPSSMDDPDGFKPSAGGVQKTTKFIRNKTATNYSDFPGKKAYLEQRTPQRTMEAYVRNKKLKVIMKAEGNLSRAYVSEPSRASTTDITKELTKSKVLPKNIHEAIKSKQAKYKPRSNSSQPNIIKMTKSKVSGKWGTPSEHRKSALKILGNKGKSTLPKAFIMSDIIRLGAARKKAKEYTQKEDPSFFDTMKMMFPIMGMPKKKHGLNFGDS